MLSLDRDNQKDKGDASGKVKPYGSYMAAKGSSKRTVAAKALYSNTPSREQKPIVSVNVNGCGLEAIWGFATSFEGRVLQDAHLFLLSGDGAI